MASSASGDTNAAEAGSDQGDRQQPQLPLVNGAPPAGQADNWFSNLPQPNAYTGATNFSSPSEAMDSWFSSQYTLGFGAGEAANGYSSGSSNGYAGGQPNGYGLPSNGYPGGLSNGYNGQTNSGNRYSRDPQDFHPRASDNRARPSGAMSPQQAQGNEYASAQRYSSQLYGAPPQQRSQQPDANRRYTRDTGDSDDSDSRTFQYSNDGGSRRDSRR